MRGQVGAILDYLTVSHRAKKTAVFWRNFCRKQSRRRGLGRWQKDAMKKPPLSFAPKPTGGRNWVARFSKKFGKWGDEFRGVTGQFLADLGLGLRVIFTRKMGHFAGPPSYARRTRKMAITSRKWADAPDPNGTQFSPILGPIPGPERAWMRAQNY